MRPMATCDHGPIVFINYYIYNINIIIIYYNKYIYRWRQMTTAVMATCDHGVVAKIKRVIIIRIIVKIMNFFCKIMRVIIIRITEKKYDCLMIRSSG